MPALVFKMKNEMEVKAVTDKILESLQAKHGKDSIVVLRVAVSEGDVAVGYFIEPKKAPNKFALYSRAMQAARQQKVIEAGLLGMNHCFLDGDARFKDQDDMVALTGAIEFYQHLSFLSATSEVI